MPCLQGDALVVKHFIVSIVKGDRMLTFECSTDGNGTHVEHMTLEPKDGYDEESTMYAGPVCRLYALNLTEGFACRGVHCLRDVFLERRLTVDCD